jgi:hypothetical protein
VFSNFSFLILKVYFFMKTFSSQKSRNFFLAAALILGSSVFNAANVAAQTPPIVALDSLNYQSGVEKYIGAVVPGSGNDRLFGDVGFLAPAGVQFTDSSYTLTNGRLFSLSDVETSKANDTLWVTIDFRVVSNVPFGDYVDTLTISAVGADPFILPLKGSSVLFTVNPTDLGFDEPVLPGDKAELELLTITTTLKSANDFAYSFTAGANSAFYLDTPTAPADVYDYPLYVGFAPPLAPRDSTYNDTLVITHPAAPNLVYRVPIFGYSAHIVTDPVELNFGLTPIDATKTLTLSVTTIETITGIDIGNNPRFTVEEAGNWNDDTGGDLDVTFAPDSLWFFTENLILYGADGDSTIVVLHGIGVDTVAFSANPASYDFGNVAVGSTGYSQEIEVVLANPVTHLDDSSFSFAVDNGIFKIESLQLDYSARTDSVYVLLSFTPPNTGHFTNTLVVSSDYVADLLIPLEGDGVAAPSLSPKQATAIAGTKATAAPAVSVKDGRITVSGAPDGSSIQVYSLQGQSLQTQAVTSLVETLQTASLPKSVYIVVVNNDNQEILRKKVVL